MSGRCLKIVLWVSGGCLKGVWRVSMVCPNGMWRVYMIWIKTAYSDLYIQQNSSYHISHRLKREDCQIYELKKSHFLHSRWLLPKAEHSTRKYLPIKRIILVQRIVLDFFTQFYTKNQASVWLYCLFREFLTNNGSPSFKDPNASQKFPKIGVFCFAFGIVFSIWQLG